MEVQGCRPGPSSGRGQHVHGNVAGCPTELRGQRQRPVSLEVGPLRAAHHRIHPQGIDSARRDLPEVAYASSLVEAISGAELLCVLTAWEEFRHADPQALGEHVAARRVIDGLNCLDPTVWTSAGWTYRGMGRPIGD